MIEMDRIDEHGRARTSTDGKTGVLLGARVAPELAAGLGALAKENGRSVSAELRLAVRHWLGMNEDERIGLPSLAAADVMAFPACYVSLRGGVSTDRVLITGEDGREVADVRRLVVIWDAGARWPWAELQHYVLEREGDMFTMQFDEADSPKLWTECRRVKGVTVGP